ncbi:hypothetical protein ERX37_05635 [Macrococcus hajekii]|uniref:Uncharacterized protein n=1 Tax=Macrococcus hajekii TaxID=198482 RepID=A0A4R6BJ22_9STAP|nr:hypothetical protein [Macrococcus hajekii]TDM01692.1 hypothetical protein ERX37_05635 [Macrococcus hajekii]GGB06623.1 hypothetical protein GCM10007190_13350 [Macrococcus hajekii]
MNKWVKIGIGAGAGYLAYRTARKTLKKYDDVNTLMNDLVGHNNYNELRDMIFDVLDMFTSKKRVEHKDEPAQAVVADRKDETITGAVKSVFDSPIIADLIPDQKNVQMIKEVIDEAAEVEKLIRGWFK